MRRLGPVVLAAALLLWGALPVGAAPRCATGLREQNPARFAPLPPVSRRVARREVAPVPTAGAQVAVTEHFRILWGDGYNRSDPDWADPDGDGRPLWVEWLAEAFEGALSAQTALGFPMPYGVERYYLDVYVANTGVVVDGSPVTLPSGPRNFIYAFTDIDADYAVAYFIVNNDFSPKVQDEHGVLRATVAHELFHAVQRVEYPWDDLLLVPDARWLREWWWFEATATWMEEVCHPDVDDYVSYVRAFLASPEEPLTSSEGLRPYGAAIFPGLLWLRYGGAETWQAVFRKAYAFGVDAALDGALQGQGRPPLVDVVAAFWALAADPVGVWPDGFQYRSGVSPWPSLAVPSLPFEVTATETAAPGRWGAHWFSLRPADLPAIAQLRDADEGFAWRVALWAPQEGGEPVVRALEPGTEVRFGAVPEGAQVSLALVNVSDVEGFPPYAFELFSGTQEQPPDPQETTEDPVGTESPPGDEGTASSGIEPEDPGAQDSQDETPDGVLQVSRRSDDRGGLCFLEALRVISAAPAREAPWVRLFPR